MIETYKILTKYTVN